MKKTILLFSIISLIVIGCKKDDPQPVAQGSPSPQNTGGGAAVKFVSSATWITCAVGATTSPAQDETVRLFLNSIDYASNVAFTTKKFNGSYIFVLQPGVYYFKSYTTMEATNGCTPYYVSKKDSAAFSVLANDTLTINIE